MVYTSAILTGKLLILCHGIEVAIISFSRESFAQNLKRYRTLEDYTQEELSLECGYDRTYVGKIERGSKDPSMEAIIRIAEVLDVPASSLFENDDEDRIETESGNFYRKAFRNAIHFILIMNPGGKILQANQAVLDFTGYRRKDIVGNSILQTSLWNDYDEDSLWIKQGLEQAGWGNSYWNELTVRDNADNEYDVAVAFSPVTLGDDDDTDIDLVIFEGFLRD